MPCTLGTASVRVVVSSPLLILRRSVGAIEKDLTTIIHNNGVIGNVDENTSGRGQDTRFEGDLVGNVAYSVFDGISYGRILVRLRGNLTIRQAKTGHCDLFRSDQRRVIGSPVDDAMVAPPNVEYGRSNITMFESRPAKAAGNHNPRSLTSSVITYVYPAFSSRFAVLYVLLCFAGDRKTPNYYCPFPESVYLGSSLFAADPAVTTLFALRLRHRQQAPTAV